MRSWYPTIPPISSPLRLPAETHFSLSFTAVSENRTALGPDLIRPRNHRRKVELSPTRFLLTGADPSTVRSWHRRCAAPPSKKRSSLCRPPDYADRGLGTGPSGGDRYGDVVIITTTDGRRSLLFFPDERRLSCRSIRLEFGYRDHFRRSRLASPTNSRTKVTGQVPPASKCGCWPT